MAVIKKITTVLTAVLLISLLITGCAGSQTQKNKENKELTLGYVQWASAEASTYLMEEVLERAGYDVKQMTVQAGAMYQGTAKGDIDSIVCAWLPKTHKSYWKEYGDKLVDLGANYEGAKIGLVVPKYVDTNSIAELRNNAEKFNKKIIGIDPGAGIMQVTSNKTLDEYGLSDWTLVESSGPAMTAKLKQAINDKKPVVVTGWTPHWKWFSFDLKFLKDSKGVYGKPEMIKTLGRPGIKEDHPEAAKILQNYRLNNKQLGKLIKMAKDAEDLEKAAAKFVDQNKGLVNQWLPQDKQLN